jgi:hypothetical protein
VTTADNETDRVEWDDIETIARDLFNVWVGAPELSWARHAWGALDSAGLTTYSTNIERSQCLFRLLVLAAIYREFCVRAFDEGDSGDWREVVALASLVGYKTSPFDSVALRALAEQHDIDTDDDFAAEKSVMSEILAELTVAEHQTVVQALLRKWSEARVFAELWVSSEAEIAYPITDDAVAGIVNHDLTASKHKAYEWLTEGLPVA